MKKDRRISKSKKVLKEALISLMSEKDFKKITITDLVSKADLNRGTFYKHFQTKEELLDELIDDVMEDLITAYREPYLFTDQFSIKDLSTTTVKIFEHVNEYSDFYTIIVNSNVLPGFQDRIIHVLTQLSVHEISMEHIDEQINANLLTSYNVYALFGLIVEWVKGGFIYTPSHMTEQLIAILSYTSNRASINIKRVNNDELKK
ncbi:TetR/AcrR family transcriptional regulator [Cytobacillus purgationiresistens]|uniref:AcrR family transcriptional regulator n=1 Tax=Cytobacillus purgationiresistens TaxID=863449 RepID=A0ABU0AK28_9BACI|nr:TetR/AcrR family transcriptional regulator [Cytobacillus purgationiresistens]MDQ0271607.1 AcrR family transcriptional regulator [Cytobacillus purgationiresistens]